MSNKSDYSRGSLLDISYLKYPNLLLLESSTQKKFVFWVILDWECMLEEAVFVLSVDTK